MRYTINVTFAVIGLLMASACRVEAPPSGSPERAVATESSATPSESARAVADASPKVEKRTVTVTKPIPYKMKKIDDATLPEGATRVRNRGVKGIQTLTYEVTFANGAETGRKLLRARITKAPVARVVLVGTKPESRCDPNYSGACVPIASDVDCAGGSGNGPEYVEGPVQVIGDDIYGLDRDGDGIACD